MWNLGFLLAHHETGWMGSKHEFLMFNFILSLIMIYFTRPRDPPGPSLVTGFLQQVCIPVGCVLPTHLPYSLQGGGVCLGRRADPPPPELNRVSDTCFATWAVKMAVTRKISRSDKSLRCLVRCTLSPAYSEFGYSEHPVTKSRFFSAIDTHV